MSYYAVAQEMQGFVRNKSITCMHINYSNNHISVIIKILIYLFWHKILRHAGYTPVSGWGFLLFKSSQHLAWVLVSLTDLSGDISVCTKFNFSPGIVTGHEMGLATTLPPKHATGFTCPKSIHSCRYFLPSNSCVICSCIFAFCLKIAVRHQCWKLVKFCP